MNDWNDWNVWNNWNRSSGCGVRLSETIGTLALNKAWHHACVFFTLMTQRPGLDPLNIIKGRIAEALVEELLRACGNNVYRFGYESLLQNLV